MHVPEGWFDSKANERQTSSLGKEIYDEDKKENENTAKRLYPVRLRTEISLPYSTVDLFETPFSRKLA